MTAGDKQGGTGVPPVAANHGRDGHATAASAIRIRQGAYLPHWTRQGGIYFVTFRLADSLPQSVLKAWKMEREELTRRARQQRRPLTSVEQKRLQELFSEKVEKHLDAGMGSCWMKRPEIADLVQNALRHFDGQRYTLLAWCVMPNHVHVVFKPTGGHELDKILHSWKSFTAHEAAKQFKVPAPFWQPEYYDHLIRDEEDLFHAIEYALNNPVAANLHNWRWVGVNSGIVSFLVGGTGVPPVAAEHGRDGHATSEEAADAD
jgi:REP element-mobilizing transposase RayT